jgi:chromosome segregation ATPase
MSSSFFPFQYVIIHSVYCHPKQIAQLRDQLAASDREKKLKADEIERLTLEYKKSLNDHTNELTAQHQLDIQRLKDDHQHRESIIERDAKLVVEREVAATQLEHSKQLDAITARTGQAEAMASAILDDEKKKVETLTTKVKLLNDEIDELKHKPPQSSSASRASTRQCCFSFTV